MLACPRSQRSPRLCRYGRRASRSTVSVVNAGEQPVQRRLGLRLVPPVQAVGQVLGRARQAATAGWIRRPRGAAGRAAPRSGPPAPLPPPTARPPGGPACGGSGARQRRSRAGTRPATAPAGAARTGVPRLVARARSHPPGGLARRSAASRRESPGPCKHCTVLGLTLDRLAKDRVYSPLDQAWTGAGHNEEDRHRQRDTAA